MAKRVYKPGSRHPYGEVTGILREEIEKIRHLYQLPKEIEDDLHAQGCSTMQLSVRYRIPIHELEWLRREDVAVPYVGPKE